MRGNCVMPFSITSRASASNASSARPNDPDLLSRPEAAAYLGVSTSCMAHWATGDRGPAFVKLGRKVWYRRSGLDAWIDTQVPARMRSGQ